MPGGGVVAGYDYSADVLFSLLFYDNIYNALIFARSQDMVALEGGQTSACFIPCRVVHGTHAERKWIVADQFNKTYSL